MTAYALPLAEDVVKENAPFAATVRLLPPLLARTRPDPDNPKTLPPTVYVFVAQLTETLLTLPPVTVPLPEVTVQVWLGFVG